MEFNSATTFHVKRTISLGKSVITLFAVSATILLVVTPILTGSWREEAARWELARAANASLMGQTEQYKDSLERAREQSGDVEKLRDYWLLRITESINDLRLRLLRSSSPEGWFLPAPDDGEGVADSPVELLKLAIQKDPSFASLAPRILGPAERLSQYRLYVDTLELVLSPEDREQPAVLNQLAYMRSLGAFELEQALKDIELSLANYPNNTAFRDTRAWVLYQMGRPQDALADAEFAVERAVKPSAEWMAPILDLLEEATKSADEVASEEQSSDKLSGADSTLNEAATPLRMEEADPFVWQYGVMRYHRGKILEALGRAEAAEEDFAWLRDQRLPINDSLR